jgi:hypothetical protein
LSHYQQLVDVSSDSFGGFCFGLCGRQKEGCLCLPVTEVVINKINFRRLRNGKEIPQELYIGEKHYLKFKPECTFFMRQNIARERNKKESKQE